MGDLQTPAGQLPYHSVWPGVQVQGSGKTAAGLDIRTISFFFQSQNFENGIVSKYVTFDTQSECDIYFDIKTVLIHGVFV